MTDIFADLHNHTTASDGDFSPGDLVVRAAGLGIKVLGVTDHDTLDGLKPALDAGKKEGIEVFPGVEISVRFKREFFTGTLHVLTYFSSALLKKSEFVTRFKRLLSQGRGQGLVRARIEKINEIFGPDGKSPLLSRDLAFEDIAAYSDNASRRHFAMALEEKLGISDKKTITRIIGNDSPAYLPSGVELDQVKGFLKTEPVVAVLAHPAAGSFPGEGHYKEVLPPLETVSRLLPEMLDAGVKGLEVYYPGHAPEHMTLLLDWAHKYDLLITGGSDCHDNTNRPLGAAGAGEQEFMRLKQEVLCAEKKSR
ncbi:PHP domain-containing protein [Desulfobacter hydrogenophilus]|uniref:PHP domain-containing protein n=1 Tax=Desulfobacter hydrogenophilus TaxID=2291 RepID=A0A328FC59_9BACT|nr:PHP domain-containing protein [Desulfobacter hydrogenophilus]NDY73780.1 PHP domain-containing protein [Desulfobacter hydrogenophilus]QBH14636.1 PHP domain-containing protein [Desulfobacter hydrogenophilus]RAM01002.1 PHP domain-containing protein [Desulfobacter hydrogenophilus]